MSTHAPTISGYTYLEPLGTGGFADVYLYEQGLPSRKVAVKVVKEPTVDEAGLEQFYTEANVMAQLSGHHAIVEVYTAGVSDDGRPFIVMEYCPPPTLGDRYRSEQISVTEALDVGIRIASAVETVHRAGILHRDIKPHNILTSAFGAPKLTDFGIASTGGEDISYGMSVPWAPPESFLETPPSDVRSDVYSLAATIYTLLAGRSPFEVPGAANDNPVLMDRVERQPVPRLTRPDVPQSLSRVLSQAMAKRMEDRPRTALDLAKQLQDVQAELSQAQTRAEVYDASPDAAEVVEDDQRTFIRPVKIILPELPDRPGTLLRPRFVSPVADHTQQRARPADETRSRPRVQRTDADAPPTVDEPAAGSSEGQQQSTRRRTPVVIGGAAALLLAGVVVAVVIILGGDDDDGEDDRTFAAVTDEPNALADYVPPPADFRADVSTKGEVTFRWKNPEPQKGDLFGIQYEIANASQPVARQKKASLTVDAGRGDIVCGQVTLIRSNGTASQPSDRVCKQAS